MIVVLNHTRHTRHTS